MAAKFEESKKYDLNKEELIIKVKEVLRLCKFKIINIDEKSGVIHAKSKLNIWSWTEDIIVTIEEDGQLNIKSECYLPTQILDWGKNKRNVRKFFSHLDK